MCLAKLAKDGFVITLKTFLLSQVALVMGVGCLLYFYSNYAALLWSHGLYWYPFILITPGLCCLFSLFMEVMSKNVVGKWLEKILNVLGKYSFEIFLVHALIFDLFAAFFLSVDLKYATNGYWWIVILIVVPACVLFIGVNTLVNNALNKILKK